VVVFLGIVLWFAYRGAISAGLGSALIGGGLAVAGVGFLDDHFRVPARLRLLIHFAAAGWALWRLNGVGPLHLGGIIWNFGWAGQLLALVGLVWMINLYNFMDGLDGLAGWKLSAPACWQSATDVGGLGGLAQCALVLAAASAGFLVWNWPSAKIFMGDVGSGFLGLFRHSSHFDCKRTAVAALALADSAFGLCCGCHRHAAAACTLGCQVVRSAL